MISSYFKKLIIPLAALAMILACSGPFAAATPQPAATLNALYTAAAQTLESMSTQGAYYTFTPPSAATPTLSILLPTSTSTSYVPGTYTSVPPLPPPVTRCDAASFISDVTYPDGSIVPSGSTFTKIWRVQKFRYLHLDVLLCSGVCWR